MLILQLDSICKHYCAPEGTVKAVDGVRLTLEPGDFAALHGPSGCGKSTLLLMAGGLLSPDAGTILIGDENPYALGADARAGRSDRRLRRPTE